MVPGAAYMDDFFTSGPTLALFDAIFRHVEGYDGIPDLATMHVFILGAEETAAAYARNYGGTVKEMRKAQRVNEAFQRMLDHPQAAEALQSGGARGSGRGWRRGVMPSQAVREGKGNYLVTATESLNALFNAGVAISVIATVLSLGMSFTLGQLVAPLRRVTLVLGMVVLNAVVIPAGGWGIARISPMDDKYVAGLVLAVVGAGGAASFEAAQLVKGADLPLAVSVVVVLQLVDIVAVPVWAGQVVTGASISAWDIVQNLLMLVLVPLAVGLVVRARYAQHARGWQGELVRAANLALAVALVAGVAANWSTIKSLLGSWVLITALTITILAGVFGLLLRCPRR